MVIFLLSPPRARSAITIASNNFRESNQEKKQRTDTINEEARLRRLRAITLQEEIEKSSTRDFSK